MFNIRRAQLQKLQLTHPSRLISTMFEELGFYDLLKHSAQAKLSEAFSMIFDQYYQTATPPPSGEKAYAFYALRLLEGVSNSWKAFYNAVADSRDELLKENCGDFEPQVGLAPGN